MPIGTESPRLMKFGNFQTQEIANWHIPSDAAGGQEQPVVPLNAWTFAGGGVVYAVVLQCRLGTVPSRTKSK